MYSPEEADETAKFLLRRSLNGVYIQKSIAIWKKEMFLSIDYIDARVAVKTIDSSIADIGIVWKVSRTIFIITAQ